MPVRIALLQALPAGMDTLCTEAREEGFSFLDRLVDEWRSGANLFDAPGELLLSAFDSGALVAVGGLNRDPYADRDGVGRLRHLYVRPSHRRAGIGGALVTRLLRAAAGVFPEIRLRAGTDEASAWYAGLGFRPVRYPHATHTLRPQA